MPEGSDGGGSSAPVPEWALQRIDDAITEHFFRMESAMRAHEKRMEDMAHKNELELKQTAERLKQRFEKNSELAQAQQPKVVELLSQMQTVLELLTDEQRRGRDRDQKIEILTTQASKLVSEAGSSQGMVRPEPTSQAASSKSVVKYENVERGRRPPTAQVASVASGDLLKIQSRVEELDSDINNLQGQVSKVSEMVSTVLGSVRQCERGLLDVGNRCDLLQRYNERVALNANVFTLKAFDIPDKQRRVLSAELKNKLELLQHIVATAENEVIGPKTAMDTAAIASTSDPLEAGAFSTSV